MSVLYIRDKNGNLVPVPTVGSGSGGTGEANDAVPSYWKTALEEGAEAINMALLEAGYNKSAFLFYTDAHWNYGSQMSPTLLKYLYQHTGMNKTFFGGDIVNNEDDDYDVMAYLWDWRNQLKGLPNHHSVVGNHDDGNTTNNLFSEQYVYGYLLAPEETPDIVRGEDGLYYYLDSPAEKTRYLFLDTAFQTVMYDAKQAQFVVDALKGTPAGWHIVAIAHIWYDTDYTVDPAVPSGLSLAGTLLLNLFDAYNSRGSGTVPVSGSNVAYDFTDCAGKVEFCIGGHTHWDYDGESAGGIPVILCETDSKHVRSGLGFAAGTITEAAVNGIIANYDTGEIKVVRVGRGASRVVNGVESGGDDPETPAGYTNQLPLATDADGNVYNETGYKTSTRLSVSSGSFEERTETGWCTSGLIPAAEGDVIRLKNCTFTVSTTAATHRGGVYSADSGGAWIQNAMVPAIGTNSEWAAVFAEDGDNIIQFTIPNNFGSTYIRIVAQEFTGNSVITVNEEII